MFCPNCGNQLSDNAQFCSSCGARMASDAAPPQNTSAIHQTHVPQQPAGNAPKKKKKTGIIVTAAVMLVFYLIGHFAGNSMANSYVQTKEPESESQSDYLPDPGSVTSQSGTTFSQVFSERYIVPSPAVFFGLDSDAYVLVDPNGIVDYVQFGHKNDVIVEWVETVYCPAEGLDMQAQDEYIRSKYDNTGLDFVSLSTNFGTNFYSYTITIRNLDQLDNLRAAVNAGLIIVDGDDQISLSATDASLIDQGYIKK